jgi:sec-independent protein translocase protein TatA
MPDIGVPELLIIAVIALLIFGPAKAADLGGALGRSIREFRRASEGDDEPTVAAFERVASAKFCTECGTGLPAERATCPRCGVAVPAA